MTAQETHDRRATLVHKFIYGSGATSAAAYEEYLATLEAPPVEAKVDDIRAYLKSRPNRSSQLHGQRHWYAVAAAGLELCKRLPKADPIVVFHFALAHDAERLNDGVDPDHGARASKVFSAMAPGMRNLALFKRACREHTSGTTSRNATVGACWDADRLNLWRIGIRPDPRFLSTAAARDPEMIEMARGFHDKRYTWDRLTKGYSTLIVPGMLEEHYGPMHERGNAHQAPAAESLPLDECGRAVLYHGTDEQSAMKIARYGLRPGDPWFGEKGKGVYLTANFNEAISHAFTIQHLKGETSGIVVFEVTIDPKRLRYDPEPIPDRLWNENEDDFYVKTRIGCPAIRAHWEGTFEEARVLARSRSVAPGIQAGLVSVLQAAGLV